MPSGIPPCHARRSPGRWRGSGGRVWWGLFHDWPQGNVCPHLPWRGIQWCPNKHHSTVIISFLKNHRLSMACAFVSRYHRVPKAKTISTSLDHNIRYISLRLVEQCFLCHTVRCCVTSGRVALHVILHQLLSCLVSSCIGSIAHLSCNSMRVHK